MATTLDICNHALLLLGEKPIPSEASTTATATRAFAAFDIARDGLLRSYRWNFAIKRAQAAPDATAPAFGFANRFALPNDCLQVIGLYDPYEPQQNISTTREPWRTENGYLLCDATTAYFLYTQKQPTSDGMDPLFVEALAIKLALTLAYAQTASADLISRLDKMYNGAVRTARMSNAIEHAAEISQTSEWQDSRYSSGLAFGRGFPGGIS